MKIVIFDMDNLKNPFWGAGQARATREVAKRLVKRGHKITVYCSKYPNYKDYKAEGVSYKHIGIVCSSPRLTNIFFILSLPFHASVVRADLILENFNAPISTSFLPIFTKIPVVAMPTMFNAKEFSKKYHLPFEFIEKLGIQFYKYMLPYSKTDSQKAKKMNPKIEFKVVKQGVSKDYFNIKHKKPKYILFLGRFDIWQKGIDLLLESFAKAKDEISYPLILAGHGSDKAKIEQIIQRLKIKNRVKIIGPTYGAKKMKLISEALFVAFPSRHDEICLWTLEALASGMPIVAFDLEESNWMGKDVSIKVKPFDTTLYAQALVRVCETSLNRLMRVKARQFAKRFDWDEVVSEIESFLEQVLAKENNASGVAKLNYISYNTNNWDNYEKN